MRDVMPASGPSWKSGLIIGPYDLVIAATALKLGFDVATTNLKEFARVDGLQVKDATLFLKG
jgi:predicted nucleic acid-binding protein